MISLAELVSSRKRARLTTTPVTRPRRSNPTRLGPAVEMLQKSCSACPRGATCVLGPVAHAAASAGSLSPILARRVWDRVTLIHRLETQRTVATPAWALPLTEALESLAMLSVADVVPDGSLPCKSQWAALDRQLHASVVPALAFLATLPERQEDQQEPEGVEVELRFLPLGGAQASRGSWIPESDATLCLWVDARAWAGRLRFVPGLAVGTYRLLDTVSTLRPVPDRAQPQQPATREGARQRVSCPVCFDSKAVCAHDTAVPGLGWKSSYAPVPIRWRDGQQLILQAAHEFPLPSPADPALLPSSAPTQKDRVAVEVPLPHACGHLGVYFSRRIGTAPALSVEVELFLLPRAGKDMGAREVAAVCEVFCRVVSLTACVLSNRFD